MGKFIYSTPNRAPVPAYPAERGISEREIAASRTNRAAFLFGPFARFHKHPTTWPPFSGQPHEV